MVAIKDIDAVLTDASQLGVKACLVCAESFHDFSRILKLCETYPKILLPCLGVHPAQEAPANPDSLLQPMRGANLQDLEPALKVMGMNSDKLAAIGEIGLDFTPWICGTHEERDEQRQVFRNQIQLAKGLGLPVNVHSRSAGRPTIEILREEGAEHVLLHAFDGSVKVAMQGLQLGYFFSVPPSIVRSEQKQKLVHKIPLENLLLETDSPALGPEKQRRNVPVNIRLSCEQIAKIKGVSTATVMEATTANALRLFPKLKTILHV
ncbi:PREDICTED: putative deoxyribonuclease TATDN3 isoform X1 [Priapulus caudatus]|uniref:Deoxyribonuclease TATDN3 isoform X1 n=1 Tax=Priapulus caudatus TaxID=37621 RepID=A0ABM1DTH1_PRICU|nr:PREDICTED: putative deoxyribonuclease TATDN3 isoform X1 [Priapulus caudatus]XP_014663243.1 PREDICTED: putative deoxyribonuclease TATDN3 isoform X1 [Priapulus caudatus]